MTGSTAIRVLLADDHVLVRESLRLLLETADLTVVAESGDGRDALQLGLTAELDLAVLDIAMPGLTGLQVARELHARRPRLPVLMLSVSEDERYFFEALKAGAAGYVLKSASGRELPEACRAVARGDTFLYARGVGAVVRDFLERSARGETAPSEPLTRRELEVVKLVAEGHTSQEIADTLVIAKRTVDRHRANILAKLGLHDATELTRYAIRRGLVEP